MGGSGLDDPQIFKNRTEKSVDTPFGKPSDVLILGSIGEVDCVLLARLVSERGYSILVSAFAVCGVEAFVWSL